MTPTEFAERMKQISTDCGTDIEKMHSQMDDLMCQVLRKHGFDEGVEIFENSDLHYS